MEAGSTLISGCASGEQFALVGYSQGAQVISELLQSLQSGALSAFMPQLVAGVTLGNPMRQAGHTFPNDPTGATGQGINYSTSPTNLLTDTPTLWWDMTNVYDLAGNIPLAGWVEPSSVQCGRRVVDCRSCPPSSSSPEWPRWRPTPVTPSAT